MTTGSLVRTSAAVLALFVVFLAPEWSGSTPTASAQSRSIDEGPVVRRVLLYRSDRFELGGSPLAVTLGDTYQRNPMLQVTADYHLTNALSLGVNVGVSPFSLETSTARNFESSNPLRARNVDFARPFLLSDVHMGVVPFSGKINQRNRSVIPYDLHLQAGFGVAMVQSDNDDLSGTRVGPSIGIGLRFFLSDSLALRIRLQDYIYATQDAAVRGAQVEESLQHTVLFSIGVSTFSPSAVRVSR